MNEEEMRQAASSAAERDGLERIKFVQNSYPAAYWADIIYLSRMLKAEERMFHHMNIGRDII